jgi:DNA-binding NarL/FixJ family response regulator
MLRAVVTGTYPLLLSSIKALLSQMMGICVIVETEDEGVLACARHDPDVVLIDSGVMLSEEHVVALYRFHTISKARVLMVCLQEDQTLILRALQAGVAGFVSVNDTAIDFESAIWRVAAGGRHFSHAKSGVIQSSKPPSKSCLSPEYAHHTKSQLTEREREVLRLVVEGRTMREIASTLKISVKTVETHRYRVMSKLNLHHITALVRYAMHSGVFQD